MLSHIRLGEIFATTLMEVRKTTTSIVPKHGRIVLNVDIQDWELMSLIYQLADEILRAV